MCSVQRENKKVDDCVEFFSKNYNSWSSAGEKNIYLWSRVNINQMVSSIAPVTDSWKSSKGSLRSSIDDNLKWIIQLTN